MQRVYIEIHVKLGNLTRYAEGVHRNRLNVSPVTEDLQEEEHLEMPC
jgi:hypothetical protein